MPTIDPTLDHLVYATPDLATAVPTIAALTGMRPVEGGPHLGLGSRNFLLGLGGRAYLEIIGPDPDQPDPDRPRPFGIDDLTSPALVAWAVAVPAGTLDTRVASARTAGYDPGPPGAMSRRRPDGVLLAWRLTPPFPGPLPFLIDWGDTPHPTSGLPVAPLRSLHAVHPDPDTVQASLAALGAALPVRAGDHMALRAEIAGVDGPVILA